MLDLEGKKVMVTGGGGFVGSHLVERLVSHGALITMVDTFISSKRDRANALVAHDSVSLLEQDVEEVPLSDELDLVVHMASPASPRFFSEFPVETYRPNSFGTDRLARFCSYNGIRLVYTSTSEAYGEPLVHPQPESYWGNVNPIGIRSVYDVSKRFGEMACMSWHRTHDLDVRIARIFNTYGPYMAFDDGRAMPQLITQALRGENMTIHGDGSQTRSFCYIHDLVEYLFRLITYDGLEGEVINIGNDGEWTIQELANLIKETTHSESELVYLPRPADDPTRRRPDLTKAKQLLNYEPQINLTEGLTSTIDYFRTTVGHM